MNILEIASNYAGVINTVITERNTCLDYLQFTAEQLESFAKDIVEQSLNSRWISVDTALPEVKNGSSKEFIICVYRKELNKSFTFSADYLNEMELEVDGGNEDCGIWSGWHIKSKHDNYDDYFEPLYLADGDKVTHWQPLPEPPRN